jgi:RNA 2',3'-cyclic 3'-phosphodiesterase
MNAGNTVHTAETGRTAGFGEGSGSRVRAFVAIELPEHIAAVLGRFQEELKALGLSLRWTRPENIHLTLKFLGEMPESDLSGICDAVDETARVHGPITLAAKGIGVFPNIRRPNVLWTGIAGQTEILTVLQRDLDVRLHELLGTGLEKRRFTGHLTLGRVKGRPDPKRLIRAMETFGSLETESFTADGVCLFSSRLMASGPVYTRIMKASLASGAG